MKLPGGGSFAQIILAIALVALCRSGAAQTRLATEFQLTKITKSLVTTPQLSYTGAQQYPTDQRDRWLEVEVEFSAAPAFTDELTFKYSSFSTAGCSRVR